jgi:concanavalin A-like lectin/glucanase superfamily protein
MHHNRSWIVICTMAAGLGAAACQPGDADDQDELQALLRDDPLEQVPPGAVEASARVAAPIAPGASSGPPVGRWTFDDCSPFRTQLGDSTFSGNSAFRAVHAACTGGIQGQGVAIAETEDIIYVPDEPTFTFESGVTVAGWFKPTTTSGTRTLIRKRDKDTSSFALVLTGGKFQFVASFGNGRAASVTAPSKARAGVFQHVAASYDGHALRLYVGRQPGQPLRRLGHDPDRRRTALDRQRRLGATVQRNGRHRRVRHPRTDR